MDEEYRDTLYDLNMLIESINTLPKDAMDAPINHYDFNSFLVIIRDILRRMENGKTR